MFEYGELKFSSCIMSDIKTAATVYPVHDLIKKRWSPRAFSEEPVSRTQVFQLLEAARWAASSYNDQPWRFVVGIKGEASYDKILQTLGEFNQVWADKAPVLLLTCALKTNSRGRFNRHYAYDTGQAVANLSIQAMDMGLYLHQMAGFSQEKAIKVFNIPKDVEPMAAIAIGYKGAADLLSDPSKKSERSARTRKDFKEFCFENQWGEAFSI